MKSPHPAETVGIVAPRPGRLKRAKRAGHRQAIPGVRHVEQAAALGTGDVDLVDAESGAAGRGDALLKGNVRSVDVGDDPSSSRAPAPVGCRVSGRLDPTGKVVGQVNDLPHD
jgi:hypothetical protein